MSDPTLELILKELRQLNLSFSEVTTYLHKAEAEIPHHLRGLMDYYHDVIHLIRAYESIGMPIPSVLLRESERMHDRMGQLIEREHRQGGAFERVIKEMNEEGGEMKYKHGRKRDE